MTVMDFIVWAPVIFLGFVYVIWVFRNFDE